MREDEVDDTKQLTLGSFLRAKRAELTPEATGWQGGLRRRHVPGLRREEVAHLAGISITWYTLLEQDRARSQPSVQVLQSLARVLQLSPAEQEHLFDLAHQHLPTAGYAPEQMTSALQRVLDHQLPSPAYIVDRYWDVVGWNRSAALLFVDYATVTRFERNVVYQHFVNPVLRRVFTNWEAYARSLLGPLRTDYGRHRNDPVFMACIERLRQVSPEFNMWWPQHTITPCQQVNMVVQYAGVGPLELEPTVYTVEHSAGLRLVLYTPFDPLTRERLASLIEEAVLSIR